jgi:hypothetical protein
MKYLKILVMCLLQAVFGMAVMCFCVLVLLEWAAGCGEHYIDAKGQSHQNQCLFIERGK